MKTTTVTVTGATTTTTVYHGIDRGMAMVMALRSHPATTDSKACGFAEWCKAAAQR